jgi:hypothetical protein
VADHNAIAEKLSQLSLNFRKELSAVLRINSVPVDSGKLFVSVYDVDGFGVAHKCVENGFTLVV